MLLVSVHACTLTRWILAACCQPLGGHERGFFKSLTAAKLFVCWSPGFCGCHSNCPVSGSLQHFAQMSHSEWNELDWGKSYWLHTQKHTHMYMHEAALGHSKVNIREVVTMAAILCQSALLGRLAAPSARAESVYVSACTNSLCLCACFSALTLHRYVFFCVSIFSCTLSVVHTCAEAAAQAVDKCNGTKMLSRQSAVTPCLSASLDGCCCTWETVLLHHGCFPCSVGWREDSTGTHSVMCVWSERKWTI